MSHSLVENARKFYLDRLAEGTALTPEGYLDALRGELQEVQDAKNDEQRLEELGDVIGTAVLLAISHQVQDPLAQAQKSIDKVERRVKYISGRIRAKPGDDGYEHEFRWLWEESKRERAEG